MCDNNHIGRSSSDISTSSSPPDKNYIVGQGISNNF
jgi:hypothetical protein